jgi:uncharacterized protein
MALFQRLRSDIALGLAVLFGAAVLASGAALADPKFPDLNGQRVVDDAHILSDAAKSDLTQKLAGLEQATTDQMVVVTVPDLQGYPIEDYGYQLGRHWGIGQSGQEKASNGQTYKDNGLLLIVAPNERKVRIEVGYGLEPVMTDAMSGLIIRNAILPPFKSGDYDAGVEAGTDAIIQQLSLDRGVAIQKAQAAQTQTQSGKHDGLPFPVIIFIIVLIVIFSRGWLPWFVLGSLFGGGGRGGGWGGGGGFGGGGGGFSGGGGSFGGGGASGGW